MMAYLTAMSSRNAIDVSSFAIVIAVNLVTLDHLSTSIVSESKTCHVSHLWITSRGIVQMRSVLNKQNVHSSYVRTWSTCWCACLSDGILTQSVSVWSHVVCFLGPCFVREPAFWCRCWCCSRECGVWMVSNKKLNLLITFLCVRPYISAPK